MGYGYWATFSVRSVSLLLVDLDSEVMDTLMF